MLTAVSARLNGGFFTKVARGLTTTRFRLKPSEPAGKLDEMDDAIKAATAQLIKLRSERAEIQKKITTKSKGEQGMSDFTEWQLHEQLQTGAESGVSFIKHGGLGSLSSYADPSSMTRAFNQQERAWDGCTAAAHVAYALSDDAFIFPITPSSPMAELCEAWAVSGLKTVFGTPMNVQQLQSEAGAAGALHGSVAAGGMGTTFTSSQGLLLMIPNMYKMAGELLPCVMHVASRALAGEALSIFGDHQDVMAARATGWGMISGQNVQDSQDLSLVAHFATLKALVPIVFFQDGFRTSAEINTIQTLTVDHMRELMPWDEIEAHRSRGLSPLRPVVRGSNQNPDVYMQAVESANVYYDRLPDIVEAEMQRVSELTGRPLSLFRYEGALDPEHIIIQMGSGVKVTEAAAMHMRNESGAKVGVLSPLLFRPWPIQKFLELLPECVQTITVLDRTKEHGSYREPLFLDVAASVQSDPRFAHVKLLGGRYGLGSKEYTPSMAISVFENAMGEQKDHFTVGIQDDVKFSSLPLNLGGLDLNVPESATQCVFFGLAGDGTVGANKNAVKIIGDNSETKAQAYFSYSSVKAGTPTVSHLRFGPDNIEAPYLTLPDTADYTACSFTGLITSLDMIKYAKPKSTFVLNGPWATIPDLDNALPVALRRAIARKELKFYTIDASQVARDSGLGKLTNNVMQTAFFNLSKVLPVDDAMEYFRQAIRKTYNKHGDLVINNNLNAVENAMANLISIDYPASWADLPDVPLPEFDKFQGGGEFVENVQGPMLMLEGDTVPVSAFPPGGATPVGLADNEKKYRATHVPEVDMDTCTQCNYCSMICPHAVIRPFIVDQSTLDAAPDTVIARKATSSEQAGYFFRIQVSAADCTGCEVCVKTCPDDSLRMVSQEEALTLGHEDNWNFLRALKQPEDLMKKNTVKGSQMQQPLIEYSAACAGCGETPYFKLLTQMFGDRMIIANATGCTSIWGNPYASTPYTKRDSDGKGPAWANSLFEDNAEFGFGIAQNNLSQRKRLKLQVDDLLQHKDADAAPELRGLLTQWQHKWQDAAVCVKIQDSIPQVLEQAKANGACSNQFMDVFSNKDRFIKPSHWIVGGDGWAYDIGYNGLDHVVASGIDVNILIVDTEAYSNTGGQKSKSTPAGSISKFAVGGKDRQKKSLGDITMAYQDVYVASISMGANLNQSVKAFAEAEAYPGPSLILAYAPCIEFKIRHADGLGEMAECQRLAVTSGYWPLYRYDPQKEIPMQVDYKTFRDELSTYLATENRFQTLSKRNPAFFQEQIGKMEANIKRRHQRYLAMESPVDESAGPPLSILYGSETGNTAELAARFAGMCKSRGYGVELSELDDLSVEDLSTRENVVLMISTCGEGQLPANSRAMYEELGKAAPGILADVNYAVFALGDTGYRHFCSAGRDFDEVFAKLGATPLMDMGIGDDKDEDKFETGFEKWLPDWLKTVKAPADPKANDPPAPLFDLQPMETKDALNGLSVPNGRRKLKVGFNKRISPDDYAYSIRHIQFLDPHDTLPYVLGDALSMYWTNDEARVREFLGEYGSNIDPDQCYLAEPLEGAMTGLKGERLNGPFLVKHLFTDLLDIFGRPSKNFLNQLSKVAPEGSKDRERLEYLVSEKGSEDFTNEISKETLTFADVLLKFPQAKPDLNQLLTMIPAIKPRLYTIASSTRYTPGSIELTVITDDWTTPSGKYQQGSCTNFFERHVTNGDDHMILDCGISPGSFNFGDPKVPMVMTGTGTGVAPFLAFAKERKWFVEQNGRDKAGDMWLFFGCRNRAKDYILGEELDQLAEENIITHLRVAFSRDGPEKVYIQDKIRAEAEGLYDALVTQKGYLYLCGQAGDREQDVLNAVRDAFAVGGNLSTEEAQAELDALIDDHRYCPELY